MKRKYFKRLFAAFLFAAVFPICLCVFAIFLGNYRMAKESYSRKVKETASVCSANIESLVKEYEEVLESLVGNQFLSGYLTEGSRTGIEEVLSPLQTGRDGRILLHVVSLKKMEIYPEASDTLLYDPILYSRWGLQEKMRMFPHETAIFPNCTAAGEGQSICLNLGRAIEDKNGKIVGYGIIDLYRDTLLNAVRNIENDEIFFVITDQEGRVILDTTGKFAEGKTISSQEELKGYILEHKKNAYGIGMNAYYNVDELYESSRLLLLVTAVVFAVTLMISFFMARIFANRMYRPIDTLVKSMNDVTEGNLDVKLEPQEKDNDEMKMVSSVFNWMINRIHMLIEEAKEESERKKDAQIKALQAQISPHFLYNMLNEIKALAKLGRTEEISEFVIHLGRLLRRSITFRDDFVILRDDMKFVEDYICLQQIRYDQMFSVNISMDEEILDCRIPNLIIQPLAENAIIHGFTAGRDDYTLSITGKRDGEKLHIEIYDNGIGVEKEYLKYINNVEKGVGLYGGLGVENVQKRLVLIYGMQYGIKMESEKGRYTKVIITLPYNVE